MHINLNILVLVNSEIPDYAQAYERVLPYLEHFGIPYDLVDLRTAPLPAQLNQYPLFLIAHPGLDERGIRLSSSNRKALKDAIISGCGFVSFDGNFSNALAGTGVERSVINDGDQLIILGGQHYITQLHPAIHSFKLGRSVIIQPIPEGEILARIGNAPLLSATHLEDGRLVYWANTDWMHTSVLGPLSGLDDLFWRSLVWAARKPFCLRGLPPFITMRVDDVAGRGGLWNSDSLYWVEASNKEGFKPWLGLFIYNLRPSTVTELRTYLAAQNATAFPHAFGRLVRSSDKPDPENDFYYYPDATPLRADHYDEFIYFDHQHGKPWSDAEALHGMQAVDEWYAAHAPLPITAYAIPHWGEMGTNTLGHVQDRWGCDLLGTYHGPDFPLTGAKWLVGGPFRKYETPGSALFDQSNQGSRPVYYADFQNFAGRKFFLSFTEIRDETGYEWAPDNDVTATAERGISQLKRALDSMALPTLFTHETDYIYKIKPENWAAIMHKINQGIALYNPIQVNLGEGIRYVRNCKTSSLQNARYSTDSGEIILVFHGYSDQPTFTCLFSDENGEIQSRWLTIPEFIGNSEFKIKI
jgi:hypothetical protein